MQQCNTTLTDQAEDQVSAELPLWGNWTFHHFGLLISFVFGSIAILVALSLIFRHATHYSKPWEQRHIIRILFMIPIYAAISVVSYRFYRHAIYWEVLRDCYEAFAIASFFTLLCHYVEPTLHEQKNYFRKLDPKNWVWPLPWMQKCTGGIERGLFRKPRSGLTWFNIIWICIFQYCLIRVVMTFVAMITQLLGRYCESSLSPEFSHVWVMTFDALSVTVAMYCLIQFYIQLKDDLAEHKPFLKVCCIKLVIFFSFWQSLLISFLSSGSGNRKPLITTGPRVSYLDIKVGIPCVLLTVEMAIFAVVHLFAFPVQPYDISKSPHPSAHYQGGPFGLLALADAFNPWDMIKASARGFRWLFVGAKNRELDSSYASHNASSNKLRDFDNGHERGRPPIPTPGTFSNISNPSHQETGVELGPPVRRQTEDEFGDRAALLAQPQGIPRLGISGTSTPYHALDEPPSPGLGPQSPGFPMHYPPQYTPQYGHLAGSEHSSTNYGPPSPSERQPSPGMLESGSRAPPPPRLPHQQSDSGYYPPPNQRPDGKF